MSEAAFHGLTATLLKVLTLRAFHTLPVAMKRGFCLLVFIDPGPLTIHCSGSDHPRVAVDYSTDPTLQHQVSMAGSSTGC
jgi:hypothetical protein